MRKGNVSRELDNVFHPRRDGGEFSYDFDFHNSAIGRSSIDAKVANSGRHRAKAVQRNFRFDVPCPDRTKPCSKGRKPRQVGLLFGGERTGITHPTEQVVEAATGPERIVRHRRHAGRNADRHIEQDRRWHGGKCRGGGEGTSGAGEFRDLHGNNLPFGILSHQLCKFYLAEAP